MQELEQYFEDYNVGDKRTTPGRTITETDIVMHAMHSGDFFPHHVDAEFAKKGPFGKRVAQFSLTHSVGIGLTAGQINHKAFTYGFDRLRFPNPVFIGDTITAIVSIKKIEIEKRKVNLLTECFNSKQKILTGQADILVSKKKDFV